MKENSLFIKEKRKDLFTRGFILLALMIVSLLCAFAPILMSGIKDGKTSFYVIGGILFAVFLSMFVHLLYKEFHPDILLILGSRGFVDKKNVGEGIEIEWTNVASVKILGNKDMPYLGITLENSDLVMSKMKKHEYDEMRDNIDENLPHILIAQNEIFMPISELKDTFVQLIREARILGSEIASPKTKQNPFTTNDVLRAFGKLPDTDEVTSDEVTTDDSFPDQTRAFEPSQTEKHEITDTITYTSANDDSDIANIVSNHLTYENESTTAEPENIVSEPIDINTFIEDLAPSTKATKTVEISDSDCSTLPEPEIILSYKPENEDSSFDELSAEINEFFSRAKFSKISELGKILNENDVPYSISKNQTSTETAPEEKISEVMKDIKEDPTVPTEIKNEPTPPAEPPIEHRTEPKNDGQVSYMNDFSIIFPDNLFNEADVTFDSGEVTFETLIQQSKALDNIAFNDENNNESNNENTDKNISMANTKEY